MKSSVLQKFPKALLSREIGKYTGKVFYAIYSSPLKDHLISSGSTIEKAWNNAYIKITEEELLLKDLMV